MVKIKVPQRVEIAAYDYAIWLCSHLMADKHNAGFIDPIKEEMRIDPHLPPAEKSIALCHEVIHLIERAFAMNFNDDDVERLAMGFVCFLRSCEIEFDWSLIKELAE